MGSERAPEIVPISAANKPAQVDIVGDRIRVASLEIVDRALAGIAREALALTREIVDAPVHFDPRPDALSIDQVPLEKFYTSAFCIDLSQVPLKTAATLEQVQEAVASGATSPSAAARRLLEAFKRN